MRRSSQLCQISSRILLATGVVTAAGGAASAGSLAALDFEQAAAGVAVSSSAGGGATADQSITTDGTIDTYMGKPSQCVTLKATVGGEQSQAGVTITFPAQKSPVTNLALLTLSADVWSDHAGKTEIAISSLDSAGKVTGTLRKQVYSPVINSWYRHSLDLSTFDARNGAFDPSANQFSVSFTVASTPDLSGSVTTRVDNLSLQSPTFYVGPNGIDTANGHSEKTPLATIQKAVDLAAPGDIILVMDGTYKNDTPAGLVTISKAGSPAKWITIRAHPGPMPQLVNDGWEVFKLTTGSAYVEIRGLEMIGNRKNVKLDDALADGVIKEKDGKPYPGDPKFNGNGISAEGRQAPNLASHPHHLRFIGNRVHDNCGGGISAISCDYVTIEGNDVRDNAHYMRYGGSGMSFLVASAFDSSTSTKMLMINNFLRNNRGYVPWAAVGKLSDGNGIILDVNIDKTDDTKSYHGRTLIANNICVGNGGGGITVTTARHADICNNTLYHNVQTSAFTGKWGEFHLGGPPPNCQDVRIYNNVVWAKPGGALIIAGRINDWTMGNNLFFGDPGAKMKNADAGNSENLIADPKLKNPSLEGEPEDFRPRAESPALRHGASGHPGVPPTDINGDLRPPKGPVTAGAMQQELP